MGKLDLPHREPIFVKQMNPFGEQFLLPFKIVKIASFQWNYMPTHIVSFKNRFYLTTHSARYITSLRLFD